jgi:aspartate carbamoyltransferase regulatory subunit
MLENRLRIPHTAPLDKSRRLPENLDKFIQCANHTCASSHAPQFPSVSVARMLAKSCAAPAQVTATTTV